MLSKPLGNFCLWGLLACQAEVFQFLNLEHLASEDLPYERGLGDRHEVGVDLHLNNAVNSDDLNFLTTLAHTFLKEVVGTLSIFLQPL